MHMAAKAGGADMGPIFQCNERGSETLQARRKVNMTSFFTPLTVTMLSISACVYIGAWVIRAEQRREAAKNEAQEDEA